MALSKRKKQQFNWGIKEILKLTRNESQNAIIAI